MAILHRIKAYLYDNLLTKDNPNDFVAQVEDSLPMVKAFCVSDAPTLLRPTQWSDWERRNNVGEGVAIALAMDTKS